MPTRDQVLAFIRESGERVGKREIARAFRLDADQKVALRRMLKELEADGALARGRRRRYAEPGELPSVAVIEIVGTDTDGEIRARPAQWTGGAPPVVYVAPDRRSPAAFAAGDRVLARLRKTGDHAYEARIIRRLLAAPPRALGVIARVGEELRIVPVNRRIRDEFIVAPGDALDAAPGELVWAETRPGRPLGPRFARVTERLGPTGGARALTLITLHDHDIPARFSEDALALADRAGPAPLAGREDLRGVALVTIDGEDARDFDDAVFAEPDDDPANRDGWHLIVAIADVAWYVRPGSALDRCAFERGNSVYFPDRVVPMLPEPLSNGWCSLKPGEDRPCLAAHLWIDAHGGLRRQRFCRAMMRSRARLTYRQVEAARVGSPDETTASLAAAVIAPLYAAYAALADARRQRGVLELEVPERRVLIGGDGTVTGIVLRERLDSHRLIEEFMITANVAAAEALEACRQPCLYRVHDRPADDKIEALRTFLDGLGLKLTRSSQLRAGDFNRILARAAGTPHARLVNEVVLRSQAQAVYDPNNIGHFGLALRRYCHFTSPIRRYADLLVHRALIAGLGLGDGGLGEAAGDFARIGEHVSATERRAAAAERDAVDRFTAAFLAEQRGAVFEGRISGVTRFGLFVSLDDSGADGLVPVRTLPDDYYVHDEGGHQLFGRSSGLSFRLGDRVEARLVEANPLTGGIMLALQAGLPERDGRRRRPASPAAGGKRGRPRHTAR
jgi:ribonuclease R